MISNFTFNSNLTEEAINLLNINQIMQEESEKVKKGSKSNVNNSFVDEKNDLDSPVTKITQNPHAQSVLAFAVAHIFLVISIQIVNYLLNPLDLYGDFSYLSRQGRNVTAALAFWILLHGIIYSMIYPVGAKYYNNQLALWMTGLTVIPLMMMVTLYCIFHYELQYLVTFAITVENTRLMMKSLSFLVEQGSADDASKTSVGKLTYFLFAPTLIYKHSYPRSSGPINWLRVARLLSVFFIFCYIGLLGVARRGLYVFLGPFSSSELLHLYLECVFWASWSTIALAFGFLHCYLNAFAEILSFADRRFYADWWNARSNFQFWRRWNLVVHNWLIQYIYKSYIRWNGNKERASFVVFGISGIFHEYVTGLALRVWYPIFALEMVLFSLFRVSRSLESVQGLFPLVLGFLSIIGPFSLMLFTYGLEYAAYINCPPQPDETSYMRLIPRFFYCIQFK